MIYPPQSNTLMHVNLLFFTQLNNTHNNQWSHELIREMLTYSSNSHDQYLCKGFNTLLKKIKSQVNR